MAINEKEVQVLKVKKDNEVFTIKQADSFNFFNSILLDKIKSVFVKEFELQINDPKLSIVAHGLNIEHNLLIPLNEVVKNVSKDYVILEITNDKFKEPQVQIVQINNINYRLVIAEVCLKGKRNKYYSLVFQFAYDPHHFFIYDVVKKQVNDIPQIDLYNNEKHSF